MPINSTPLQVNNYYILRRNNINYIIYVTNNFDDGFQAYSYTENLNLIIGNDQNCNVYFPNDLLNGIVATIKIKEGSLVIEKNNNTNIYINKLIFNTKECYLKFGDQLNVYGLKITFLNKII